MANRIGGEGSTTLSMSIDLYFQRAKVNRKEAHHGPSLWHFRLRIPIPMGPGTGPDLVERAGQGSRADREQGQTGRGKGSNSSRSRGGFDRPVTIYRGRDREYSLRESEVRTLTESRGAGR